MERGIPNYIRVFATVMVFAVHYSVIMLGGKYIKVSEILGNGGNGPAVFFVLSGYLTWYSMNKNRYSTRRFYIKRLFRLAPIYYLVLTLQMLFREMPADMTGLGWLRYFSFINAAIPSNSYYVWNNIDGYWTMSSFALFYLMVPVLYKVLKKSLSRSVFALGASFIISQGLDVLLPLCGILNGCDNISAFLAGFPVSNMYFFVIGIVTFCAVQEKRQTDGILIGLGGVLGCAIINKTDYLMYALLTAIILMCGSISEKPWAVSQRIDKAICWGAGISYAVYLVHMPILEICQKYLKISIFYKTMIAVLAIVLSAWILTQIDRKIFYKLEVCLERKIKVKDFR